MKTAKLFKNGESQAVRLPKEFRFEGTEVLIQRAMASLRQGRTSFVIAHRLSTIRDADLILVMEDGHIVEQGTHDSLLAAGGAYARLDQAQFAHAMAEVA